MQQNNNITEIGMIVLAALLVIGGVVLIYLGKITFVEFSPFLVSVLGLFGINVAYKAPSPAQAQQLNNQQQQLAQVQQAIAPLTGMAHVHAEPAPQPAPLPVQLANDAATTTYVQPVQQFQQPAPKSWTSLETPVVTAPTQ